MSDMNWVRSFFGALVLAVVVGLGAFSSTAPAFAQQIVVEGATVDPSALKPYFAGTDPASIQRGVDDLKATGIYSSVSAKVVGGKIVVSLAKKAEIINRVAFEGNRNIE